MNGLSYEQLLAYIQGLYDEGGLSEQDYNRIVLYILANGNLETSPRDLIQIRRGLEENIPNLAQGELGFTIDTQELFVGGLNGNVKIGDKNILDVQKFGAKGTGAINDGEALKKCFDSVQSGDVVFFPKGTYLLDNESLGTEGYMSYMKLVNKNNIKIISDGAKIIAPNINLNEKGLTGFYFEGCENITIDGFDMNFKSTGGVVGIDTRANLMVFNYDTNNKPCSKITIRNCNLHLSNPNGASPGGTSVTEEYTKLIGVYFRGYYDSSAIETNDKADFFVFENNTFYDTTARVLWCWYANNVKIRGNNFINSGWSFLMRMLVGNTNFTITDNYFSTREEFSQPAIQLERQSSLVDSNNCVVSNNIFETKNSGCVYLNNIYDTVVSNNIMKGQEKIGINITGGSEKSIATGNIIDGYETGIQASNTVDVVLSGNNVKNCSSSGFRINADKCIASSNNFHGNRDDIEIAGGVNIKIDSNIFKNDIRSPLFVSGSVDKLQIKNNTFNGAGPNSRTINSGTDAYTKVVITNNEFYDNQSGNDIIRNNVSANAVVANNVFENNVSGNYRASTSIVYNNVLNGELVDIPQPE